MEVHLVQRIGYLRSVMRVTDTGERLVGYLEQAVGAADRLDPLPAGLLLERAREDFRGQLGVQRGGGRQVRAPPGVGGDVLDQRPERGRIGREQQHLGHRRQFRLPALLVGLLPEDVEVRRQRAVAHVLAVVGLELGDHRGVVGGPVGVGAAVNRFVARRRDEGRQDRPERVAVGVVRVHAGHVLVLAREPVPHGHETALEFLQAEEEHGAVLERRGRGGRVAAQAAVPGLPGVVRG